GGGASGAATSAATQIIDDSKASAPPSNSGVPAPPQVATRANLPPLVAGQSIDPSDPNTIIDNDGSATTYGLDGKPARTEQGMVAGPNGGRVVTIYENGTRETRVYPSDGGDSYLLTVPAPGWRPARTPGGIIFVGPNGERGFVGPPGQKGNPAAGQSATG